jgi:hypothetical protein
MIFSKKITITKKTEKNENESILVTNHFFENFGNFFFKSKMAEEKMDIKSMSKFLLAKIELEFKFS